jgi:hypothetical protein
MVKNWADQSSDDEEDAKERVESLEQDLEALEQQGSPADDPEHYQEEAAPAEAPAPRVYDFPTEPPFTAFIGNVAYTINDPAVLAENMTLIAKDILNVDIVVTDARIMYDKKQDPPKHRGFGYLTV